MTEDQLQALARECGAQLYQDSAVYFREISLLQAFALRIEAQAIKSEQQGKQAPDDKPLVIASHTTSMALAFHGVEVTLKRYT